MPQDLFDDELVEKRRPTFLKVLCILTFIGSGLGLVNSVISYFNAESMSNIMNEVKIEMKKDINEMDNGSPEFADKVAEGMTTISTPENLRTVAILTLATSALCLLGAILMWNLHRNGFYIYTTATIISIIIPFYMFGNNIISNTQAGVAGFIGVLFVIFYAMNIKSMK